MACSGYVGLAFLAITGFGLIPKIQAAENILPDHQVQADLVTLRGNTRPEAKAINDRGQVSDDMMFNHMMVQLQRTPEQEQALQQFIKDIHDPASPLFHHWITAAEFGERYGFSSASIARVTDWLESQGFKVNLVYPNQMVIDFTGSAGQIRRAFRTEIHNLQVNGHAHIANMSDPQIPAALVSTVAGVISLNDFRPHPTLHPRAKYTVGDGYYVVVPADLATIYNFNPAFAAGISGQGQTIVLIEDTDVYSTTDWNTFRSTFGLAAAYPLGSLAQVHPPSSPTNNCTDPGYNGDDIEATLDVEWASAAAPSAAIVLASCSDTDTNFGGGVLDEGVTCPEFQGPRYVTDTEDDRTSEGAGRTSEPLQKRRLALVFRLH
jgi:subtilase family serine protease